MRSSSRPMRWVLRGLGALVLPGTLTLLYTQASGCGAPCTGSERVYDQGQRFSLSTPDARLLRWQSSPIDGPFLPFEGATTYHFQHKLGVRPTSYGITLSFTEHPEAPGSGGSALSSGNLALLVRSDENEIVVKSDTCASYFINVWVEAFIGGSTDAGVDAVFDAPSDGGSDAASDAPVDGPSD